MTGGDKLHVTIWDAEGEVVFDGVEPCCTATEEEIDAMVRLIENGVPAHVAAYVITGRTG